MPFMAFIAGFGDAAFLVFMLFIAGAGVAAFIAFMAAGMVMNGKGSDLRNVRSANLTRNVCVLYMYVCMYVCIMCRTAKKSHVCITCHECIIYIYVCMCCVCFLGTIIILFKLPEHHSTPYGLRKNSFGFSG